MSAASPSPSGRAQGGTTASIQGNGPSDGDLDHAISLLRARIEEEFRIRERLDTKQRQAFALAIGFFAVAQTVALRFLDGDSLSSEKWAIAASAVLAGALVTLVGVLFVGGEKLDDQDDLKPAAITKWLEEASATPAKQYVPRRIVSRLTAIAEARTESNRTLAGKVEGVQTATAFAVAAIGLELVIAVGTQIT